jgi:hypothetical protein
MPSNQEGGKHYYFRSVKELKKNPLPWTGILFFTCLSISAYIFFEGLFILTRPSIYSSLPIIEKLGIWLMAGSLLAVAGIILLFLLMLISKLPLLNRFQRIFKYSALLIPAAVSACLILIQFDNVTYSALGIGIPTSHNFRFIYLLLLFLLTGYFYFKFSLKVFELYDLIGCRIPHKYLTPAIILINLIILLITYQPNPAGSLTSGNQKKIGENDLPNIIFITADGLNASHTSVYGYARNTTPGIKELAETSLVAENAFTNSSKTEGSLISLYTGRYPSSTRVLFPPDILKGEDSYLHLPGILHSMGYYTVQYTYPYFADAFDENLLEGFDAANGRSFSKNSLFYILNKHIQTDRAHFLYEIAERNLGRLRHIFYLGDMANLQSLAKGIPQDFSDQVKIQSALETLLQSDQPVFIHIHWLGTHGPTFLPVSRGYSGSKDIHHQQDWDADFYDDTVVDFDTAIGGFIDELHQTGIFDNTILLISSDHGAEWNSYQRIPLIIHFPQNEFSGRINSNVQLIDVAPTILDYLDQDIPDWMEGDSLLKPLPDNPILSFNILGMLTQNENATVYNMDPPFYQFGFMGLIYCDRIYQLDLKNYTLEPSLVKGHTSPCVEDSIPSDETVVHWMIDHLRSKGFNVSDLSGAEITYIK